MRLRRPTSVWAAFACVLVASLVTVTEASAVQEIDAEYFVPAVELRRAAPPPLRLAERAQLAPLGELDAAFEAAAQRLAEMADWNRAGKLPARSGFVRGLPAVQRVTFEPAIAARMAAPTASTVRHQGGLLARTAGGDLVWGAAVRVAGAYRLRLHLTAVDLPPGALMWVYGADGESVGPFGLELQASDGALWTPSVGGEVIRFEVQFPAAAVEASRGFAVAEVAEVFRLDAEGRPIAGISPRLDLSCLRDAQCFGPATFSGIESAQRAIAHLQFVVGSDVSICTGGLLNDADTSTVVPFFLTANHCFANQKITSTLEAFWDYFTATCNGPFPNLGTLPRSLGGTLLASGGSSDYTLLRLNTIPGGRTLLGSNPNPQGVGTTLHRISHPLGFAQGYSRSMVVDTGPSCQVIPRPNWLYQAVNLGGTQGGSSGSPVMLDNLQVVGQLTGACGPDPVEGCDRRNSDVDGAYLESAGVVFPFLAGTAGPSTCFPGPTTLCLIGNRFKVEIDWRNPGTGAETAARVAGPRTPDSGLFYFNNPNNWEFLVKAVNGCGLGGHYWVFFAATTNVHFELTVTDTKNGKVQNYFNPPRSPANAVTDTLAFATCP